MIESLGFVPIDASQRGIIGCWWGKKGKHYIGDELRTGLEQKPAYT